MMPFWKHYSGPFTGWLLVASVLFVAMTAPGGALLAQYDARVVVRDITLVNFYQLEFDLTLERLSDRWDRWANGTYQLRLPSSMSNAMVIEYLPGSSQLPENVYRIRVANVNGQRLSITILGPDQYDQCVTIARGQAFLLGRFRISSDVLLKPEFEWITPIERFQANAYKLNQDTLPWYQLDDNVEMETEYLIEPLAIPKFQLADFVGLYIGDLRVRLEWHTRTESESKGFYLVRGIRAFSAGVVSFIDTIARWTQNSALQGRGYSQVPSVYSYIDTVQYRGERYVYYLLWENYSGEILLLDSTEVLVPHSVIAFAQVNPNPTSEKATLEYVLDDRVRLSGFINDLNGRKFMELFTNVEKARGSYTYEIVFPPTASQGLYDLVLVATPVNDDVDRSTAVIKLQIVK